MVFVFVFYALLSTFNSKDESVQNQISKLTSVDLRGFIFLLQHRELIAGQFIVLIPILYEKPSSYYISFPLELLGPVMLTPRFSLFLFCSFAASTTSACTLSEMRCLYFVKDAFKCLITQPGDEMWGLTETDRTRSTSTESMIPTKHLCLFGLLPALFAL